MKNLKSYILITCFILGIFILGTDNLVIGPLLNQIAVDTSSSVSKMALGITLYSIAYGAFALLLAPISDIFGRKPVVVISSFLFGMISIAIAISHNAETFFIFRFLSGVCASVLGPNLWAYSNENFQKGTRELIVSWMMSAFSLSTVLGIPIGLLVAETFGWSKMFLYIGIISCTLSILFLINGNRTHSTTFSFKAHFRNIKQAFDLNWRLSFSMLFSASAYLCIYPFVSYWLGSVHKWSIQKTTLAFLIIGITGLIGNIMSGILLQKIPSESIVKASWNYQFLTILLMLLSNLIFNNSLLFVGTLSIWTFLSNLGNTAFISLISSKAGNIRGSIMALNNSSIFLGFTLGSYFGGILWGFKNSLTVNIFISLVLSIVAISFLMLQGRCRKIIENTKS